MARTRRGRLTDRALRRKLSPAMTLRQFDQGYWYATEIKKFARLIGFAAAHKLRKDELEKVIRHFLTHGRLTNPTTRDLSRSGVKDVERGLRLNQYVSLYTNDHETKAFLEREARKLDPTFTRRSGARYRLNRWREAQLMCGRRITYRDLVKEYVRLNCPETTYKRIPSGRYINFLSDFLAANPGAGMAAAVRAWKAVKRMDLPKHHRAFAQRGDRSTSNAT